MLQHLKDGVRDWLRVDEDKQLTDISLEYDYKDLHDATGGFSKECHLGAGAAGAVYKGTLRSGTEVAIKVLLVNGGLNGFEDEVRVLSRFRHPNLVTLLGWGQSINEKEKYLIYELLEGGDVSHKLDKSRDGRVPWPWPQRLRVALDSACGLSHMMNSTPKAFHRDIKPANILLDASGGAKMADFGLAGTIRDNTKQLMVENISGTPGYTCPEYIQTGRVSEQSEVYSFGTVLLELLVNQPPALAGPQGDIIYPLLQIVQPAAPGAHARILQHLDRFAGWLPGTVLDQFAELALSCVDMVPDRRPPFENVVLVMRRLLSAAGPSRNGGLRTPPKPFPPQQVLPSPPVQGRGAAVAASAAGMLGEVVLTCTRADSVDLSALLPAQQQLVFTVDPVAARAGRWIAAVGRQHQPDLFEHLIPSKDRLSSVSRTHFQISLAAADGAPAIQKLSGNPLLVDDKPLAQHEPLQLQDGSRIGFTGTSEKDPAFLELKVQLRLQPPKAADGLHAAPIIARPALSPSPSPGPSPGPSPQQLPQGSSFPAQPVPSGGGYPAGATAVAVLECVGALGANLMNLAAEAKAIALPLDIPVGIGRQQQVGFFEQLLQADPSWLSFISRTHCRVQLMQASQQQQQPPPVGAEAAGSAQQWLKVDNLSTNPVFVNGRAVQKGWTDTLPEGGILSFRAKGLDDRETTFVELKLRRARSSFRC